LFFLSLLVFFPYSIFLNSFNIFRIPLI
jgi:hypothetical protein